MGIKKLFSKWQNFINKKRLAIKWRAIIGGKREKREHFWEELTLKQLQKFISAGVDVNAKGKGKFGVTPLHHATFHNGSIEVIKELINAGADVNAQDNYDKTPLHMAVEQNRSIEVIKELIKAGADVNAKNEDSETPLHMATEQNRSIEVVKELIKAGADVNARVNARMEFPFLNLSKAGADVNAEDEQGETPYDYLLENDALKDSEEAKALLKPKP